MAHFLRDEELSDLRITAPIIRQLTTALAARLLLLPEYAENQQAGTGPHLVFTIRFDEKGYRVFDPAELLRRFHDASRVERIVFEVLSSEAVMSGKIHGSYLVLQLDTNPNSPHFLTVSSDDEDWMNASFSIVKEILRKANCRNGWIRSAWSGLAIQLAGVLIGFGASYALARKVAPTLAIENPFLISFFLLLLLYSNIWGFISSAIVRWIFTLFPSIRFHRPSQDTWHWVTQAVITSIVGAIVLFILGMTLTYVLDSVVGAFKTGG